MPKLKQEKPEKKRRGRPPKPKVSEVSEVSEPKAALGVCVKHGLDRMTLNRVNDALTKLRSMGLYFEADLLSIITSRLNEELGRER